MTEKTLASPKPSEIPIASNLKKVFRQYGGILGGMVMLIILFNFINDSFLAVNNITNIILRVSIIAIAACEVTYVLLLGDISLSVDSAVALIDTLAVLGALWGTPFVLLVLSSITTALALGMINGGLTAMAGIPSFIVTVATMEIFRGIAYIVTDGVPIMIEDDAFLAPGGGEFLYIPTPIWILIILLLINCFILTKTAFGRKVCIAGGNKEAAVYSGINATRLKIKVFMITAVLADISGMILASRLYSGQLNSALSYELDAIVAAILGGINLNDDYGTVMGTVIGTLTIGVTNNGMNLVSVPYFYQMVVKGLIVLVAVYFDIRDKRKRS